MKIDLGTLLKKNLGKEIPEHISSTFDKNTITTVIWIPETLIIGLANI